MHFNKNIHDRFGFKFIKVIGFIRRNVNYFKFHKSPYRLDIDNNARTLLGHEPTVGVVRTTELNYQTAVKGFDHAKIIPDNDVWEMAKHYTYLYLKEYIPKVKPQYTSLYMDYSTGPGFPLNLYFKTKAEVPEQWIIEDFYSDYEPYIWHLAMKKEKLDILKIVDKHKQRSFMMACATYLMKQKVYSQSFNEHMKKVPWSAYGFNWHRKGFHKLFKKFKFYPHIVDYDVTYWDKSFPLKQDTYELREKFLDMTEDETFGFWLMADDEITPHVMLPTGELIQMDVGQCSGSENTTSDNTVGHIMIILYEALRGAKDIFGSYPSLRAILDNVRAVIYSDDNVSGYTDAWSFMKDPIRKDAIFKEFGMAIEYNNAEKWNYSACIEGHSFLGFQIKEYFGKLVPYFDYVKVKNSTVVLETNEGPDEQIERFKALLELLVFTPHYEEYKEFVKRYANLYDLETGYIPGREERIQYELCLEGGRWKEENI